MTAGYDVLIIGSGAGGGTLAYRLALAGKRVLLLERGSFLPQEKANWNTAEVFIKNRYHTQEVWRRSNGKELHPGTGYWVGGNTKVYGAALFRLRKEDFNELNHKGGVSPEWPVKYDEFEPYYTQAEELFHVHGQSGIDPTEPPRSHEYPYPPISNEARMQEIEDKLKRRGLTPFPTPLGLKLNEKKPLASACIRCDTCDAYPCLVHAKSDADINCVRQIMHLPHVTVMTNTKVTRLITNASGSEITHVEAEVGNPDYGGSPGEPKRMTLTADIVVVSCGAINSAALLLLSSNTQHPAGLANSSGLVGRNFMFHQSDTILAISRKKVRDRYLKTVSVNDFYFGTKDYPYPMGNVQPLGSVHPEMLRADAPFFAPHFVLKFMAEHAIPWWLTTEDLPDPNNRVTIVNGRVQLNYTMNNVESFDRLVKTWVGVLKDIDQADAWFHLRAYFKKRVTIEGVGHQNGTCRFGRDPKHSVLNTDCRTHDIHNLYVVDASFFPSCGAVNPCLTIIANALRVADRILQRMEM